MIKKIILPIFALAIAAAQPPGTGAGSRTGQAPSFTEIKAYLGLSDTQLTSIVDAGKAAREANRTIAADLRTKEKALRASLDAGSTDANAIGRAVLDIQAVRKQMEANHTKARTQALSFLSAEQKTKLDALATASNVRREIRQAHILNLLEGGPGGPGGRGPRGGGPGTSGMNRFRNFRR